MSLTKKDVTELINSRRRASLNINVEHLQYAARQNDMFYENYWDSPASDVPQYVYRYWFRALLDMPRDPKSLAPQIFEIHAEPKDYEWMLDQLLE